MPLEPFAEGVTLRLRQTHSAKRRVMDPRNFARNAPIVLAHGDPIESNGADALRESNDWLRG